MKSFWIIVLGLLSVGSMASAKKLSAVCTPIGVSNDQISVTDDAYTSVNFKPDGSTSEYKVFMKLYPVSSGSGRDVPFIHLALIKQTQETKGLTPDTLPGNLFDNMLVTASLYFNSSTEHVVLQSFQDVGLLWGAICTLAD